MQSTDRLRNRLTAALIVVMAAVLAALVATSQTEADRVDAIGTRIKCPVCQGESIADSPSQMARDMLALVAERVDQGRADQEIIDELLASFSGAVLLDPPLSGATLWLWLAPAAVVIIGIAVIAMWRRSTPRERSAAKKPRLSPTVGLAIAFGIIAVVAGLSIQDRAGPASGAAEIDVDNLDDVSNETLEAVILANAGHPEIPGMRLALAERYYDAGDYRSAFPHYLDVAGSAAASGEQVVAALVRLGWMAWDGNREVEAALGLFDQALDVSPESVTARYLKGQVLWCGAGDFEGASSLFVEVLDDPGLPEDSRELVEADLEAVRARTSCT